MKILQYILTFCNPFHTIIGWIISTHLIYHFTTNNACLFACPLTAQMILVGNQWSILIRINKTTHVLKMRKSSSPPFFLFFFFFFFEAATMSPPSPSSSEKFSISYVVLVYDTHSSTIQVNIFAINTVCSFSNLLGIYS